jgi:hypothetical protein
VIRSCPRATRNAGCRDCPDSTVVTDYTDVRTFVSQILRQNCRTEVSYSMHIFGAIAFELKALPGAKVMITHMGFHAMPWDVSGQGRAAQLVNPLSAGSRFDGGLGAAGDTKSQVAACNGQATRRSGRHRCPGQTRAATPAGPPKTPEPASAGVDPSVHARWLPWTALCAPWTARPSGRWAAGGPPRHRAAGHPGQRARAGSRSLDPAATPGRPASGRNDGPCVAGQQTWRNRCVNSTSQYRPGVIVLNFSGRPVLFGTGSCTCSAQFTYHNVVGVFQ